MASPKSEQYNLLSQIFLSVKSKEEIEKLLGEIFSPAELTRVSQRILITKALLNGQTYREIEKQLGASTYVIYRVKSNIVNARPGILKRFFQSYDDQAKEK